MAKKKDLTIQDLYELVIKLGIKYDPREKLILDRYFKDKKEAWKKCKTKFAKECFDQDTLWNPYSDSRMLQVDLKKKIKKIACGIDIETPELLVIKKLNEEGAKIDLVLAHHPEDLSLLGLGGVMDLQIDIHADAGVPENIIEKLLRPRISEVNQSVHSMNYVRVSKNAELLGLNFGNVHTPCDNAAYSFLYKIFNKKKNLLVGDIIKKLQEIPEFKEASKLGNPPIAVSGNEKNRAGKIVVTGFTGGTSGNKEIYEKMSYAGVGTILAMHMSKDSKEETEKYGINVINCGHMASDSLGMNIVFDEVEKQGIEILPLSGFIRYSRNKKKFIR